MTAISHERGWPIENDPQLGWVYSDIRAPITGERPCARCGRAPVNGRDACLGDLPGIISACCGHGVEPPYRIECRRCGDCCRNNGPVPPIVAEMDTNAPEWLRTLCNHLAFWNGVGADPPNHPCVMLTDDNRCALHSTPYKPAVCRDFDCVSEPTEKRNAKI